MELAFWTGNFPLHQEYAVFDCSCCKVFNESHKSDETYCSYFHIGFYTISLLFCNQRSLPLLVIIKN